MVPNYKKYKSKPNAFAPSSVTGATTVPIAASAIPFSKMWLNGMRNTISMTRETTIAGTAPHKNPSAKSQIGSFSNRSRNQINAKLLIVVTLTARMPAKYSTPYATAKNKRAVAP